MAKLMCESRDTRQSIIVVLALGLITFVATALLFMLYACCCQFQAKYLGGTKKKAPLPDTDANRTEDGDNSVQDIRGQFETNGNKWQCQELEAQLRDLEHRITDLCRGQAESKLATEALLERLAPDALFARSAERDGILDAKLDAIWYALQAIVHSARPNSADAAQGIQ